MMNIDQFFIPQNREAWVSDRVQSWANMGQPLTLERRRQIQDLLAEYNDEVMNLTLGLAKARERLERMQLVAIRLGIVAT